MNEPEETGLIVDTYHFPLIHETGRAAIFDIEIHTSMFEELKRQ